MGNRVFQYINIAIAGAALATCGAIFQGSMRNTLVGPSTMGVNSGGMLGCIIYVFCFETSTSATIANGRYDAEVYSSRTFWDIYQQQFFVLIGCFAAVAVVLAISTIAGRGKLSAPALLISGMVLSSVVENISQVIQYIMILKDPNDTRIEAIRTMMMGDFTTLGSSSITLLMGIPISICFIILLFCRGKMNLLSMGDDEATMMGVNVQFYRNLMIIIGTVLTAVVTAFAGRVGFLGFMVPMVTRRIVGPDMKMLIPASMLVGAIMLTVVYDVAYFLGLSSSMNMVTSSIGAIVMLVTLLRGGKGRKGGENHAAGPVPGGRGMGMR